MTRHTFHLWAYSLNEQAFLGETVTTRFVEIFVLLSLALCVYALYVKWSNGNAWDLRDGTTRESAMLNPYKGLDWKTVKRVPSATHMHCQTQNTLDNGYRYGIRHFPVSNYYPSAPYDANTRYSDFTLRQSWPVKRNGELIEPPINWNEVITWQDELDERVRARLPFGETGLAFTEIPDDIILSHNAEHHGFTNSSAHICSPGSSFASGTFDVKGREYRLKEHGIPIGFGGTWQEAFRGMIRDLDDPAGGGIVICHPTWFSRLKDSEVLAMLDFDERVLGIEIFNHGMVERDWSERGNPPGETEIGFSLHLWDRILSTGRRCWAFCVPDHAVQKGRDWTGRCILLVPDFTESECLRAYRNGSFYGCLMDNGLTVTDFHASDTEVSVKTSRSAKIMFITNEGLAHTATGTSAAYLIPIADGKPAIVYVRVEISDDTGERLFLQPVMYNH